MIDSIKNGQEVTMTLKFSFLETMFNDEIEDMSKNSTESEHVSHLSKYSEVLIGKVKDLGKLQEYEIAKEGEFKDTISKTNSMIQWCAIIQTFVFCILGAWQIFSLRRFFAKRGLA
eukprot:TRINITY_DN2074_c0_g1_i2.p4 TRINITY_DN2074_c0_g1~~TRINITY_DN2074_c0_g1_i2.p4  ORF type:complete len:116 (-),score=49.92 TRINITY_DN2074_c0_g1_i2:28-375(-)